MLPGALAAHVFVSHVSQRCLLTRQADTSGWHGDTSPRHVAILRLPEGPKDTRLTTCRHVAETRFLRVHNVLHRSCNKHNSKHKLVLLTSNLIIILLDLSIRCIFSIKNPIFLGPGDHLKSNVQYCPIIMKKCHADNDGCRWMYMFLLERFLMMRFVFMQYMYQSSRSDCESGGGGSKKRQQISLLWK